MGAISINPLFNSSYNISSAPSKVFSKRRHYWGIRRSGLLHLLILVLFASTALFILYLVLAIISGTRSNAPEISTFVRKLLPAGSCLCESSTIFTCQSALHNLPTLSDSDGVATPNWKFQYGRDDQNLGLTAAQCDSAFPGLFEDIDRAVHLRWDRPISKEELHAIKLSSGMVRAMISDGKLYILETELQDSDHRKKALATLHSIHRSISAVPSRRKSIPNVEFVFVIEDMPQHASQPLWVLARRAQDENLWLMPDFGFWSWDLEDLGPFDEVASQIIDDEVYGNNTWENKLPLLFWRGKMSMSPKLRRELVAASQGQSWSAVESLLPSIPQTPERGNYVSASEQCKYRFIAHAEGRSYSGSLKYRQLCTSIPVLHTLQWIQHHHYLLSSSGPTQNFIEVERDFSDLQSKIEYYLMPENMAEAEKIARNSVRTFRERYLTQAAEACYWRRLIRAWREVSFEAERGTQRGLGMRVENFVLLESEQQLRFGRR